MRREGLGSYAMGTALTGRSCSDIENEVKAESREIYELMGSLANKVGIEVSKLRPHFEKAYTSFKGSKASFLRHLLATTPTNLKYTLNLKDFQYNPERVDVDNTKKG